MLNYKDKFFPIFTMLALLTSINSSAINLQSLTGLYLEAECATTIGDHWQIENDANASNGEYLVINSGSNFFNNAPTSQDYYLSFDFSIDQAGVYDVWCRSIAADMYTDSYWIKVDNGNWVKWNGFTVSPNWQWSQVHDWDNSKQIVQFNLSAGDHEIIIAHREKGTKLDKVFITNSDSPQDGQSAINCMTNSDENKIYLETECATTIGSNWQVGTDTNASNGKYLVVPSGSNFFNTPSSDQDYHLSFSFTITETSNYCIYARALSADMYTDSYWIKVDDGDWVKWNGLVTGSNWIWDQVHDWDNSQQIVEFNLSAGDHTLYISHREKGSKIDQLFIAKSGRSPVDGQTALNCVISNPSPSLPTSFRLTTNSSSQIQLDWKDNSSNETGFEIWRSEEPDANYSLVHTTAADVVTYTDNGLSSGTQYFYKIRALGENNSEYTLVKSTITQSELNPGVRSFQPQYNGNISAIKWGNSSDGVNTQEKLYEYDYDPMNRLKFADYVEKNNTTGSWNQKVGGYNMEVLEYDLNGNIRELRRFAHENQLRILDNMTYTYENDNRSNRLQRVTEAGGADVKEGFVDGNLTDVDYEYDDNGNLVVDNNKGIVGIDYNHLNLPQLIDFGTKGKIRYIYDAAGIKLRKDVLDENGTIVEQTFYINGIQYRKGVDQANASLDFIQTEEGRAVPAENSTFAYEYFLKDHLGNVRASLKTEPEVIDFTAGMEQIDAEEEEKYFKNLESRQNDAANAKNGSYSAYLNNASEFAKNRGIGPAIMLRVSPGDVVNASVYGKYADKTDNTEHVVDNIFTLLATAFGLNAATSEAGLTANGMENALVGQGAITPDGTAPKAYLNYIFLDKNFNPGNTTTGFERLPSGALNNYQLMQKEISIDKEGFLYIFVANESPYDQGVWFDDFNVEVTKSPVAAVSDYYPFGMLQAGNSTISSDPLGNKYLYNGKELQEDLGLQWYDYGARMYQADVGRWFAVDNKAEKFIHESPYGYTSNNPIYYIDPDGNEKRTYITYVNSKGKRQTITHVNKGKVEPVRTGQVSLGKWMLAGTVGFGQIDPYVTVDHDIVEYVNIDAEGVMTSSGEITANETKGFFEKLFPSVKQGDQAFGHPLVADGFGGEDAQFLPSADFVGETIDISDLLGPRGGGKLTTKNLAAFFETFKAGLDLGMNIISIINNFKDVETTKDGKWTESKDFPGEKYSSEYDHSDSATYIDEDGNIKKRRVLREGIRY